MPRRCAGLELNKGHEHASRGPWIRQPRPYLGEVVGVFGDRTPLQGRGRLFDEEVDRTDPWQFLNFRVT